MYISAASWYIYDTLESNCGNIPINLVCVPGFGRFMTLPMMAAKTKNKMTKSQRKILMDLSFDGNAYTSPKGASALLKAIGANFFRVARAHNECKGVVIFTHQEWNTERAESYHSQEIGEFELRHYGKMIPMSESVLA